MKQEERKQMTYIVRAGIECEIVADSPEEAAAKMDMLMHGVDGWSSYWVDEPREVVG